MNPTNLSSCCQDKLFLPRPDFEHAQLRINKTDEILHRVASKYVLNSAKPNSKFSQIKPNQIITKNLLNFLFFLEV